MAVSPPGLSLPDLHRPAIAVAPDLVGCTLVRRFEDGRCLRGIIVETEAYEPGDPACHGYRRRTARNATMFGPPGSCYVYLIYGMYHCLNIVTDAADVPSAVLIRALALDPLPPWMELRPREKPHRVAAGPGKLCRALDIDRSHDGTILSATGALGLESRRNQPSLLVQTTRIGLTQGADLPWRWYWPEHPAVSKLG
ncbi:DNA-3-methyladenine glycosylase [Leptolyngbya sp. PCC 6406]|uniref:DNA-3-methyladenine glycosylase n=1 Tax=Leptolyngbya sp. PCC 6406 TaxID=1173264 RepID=UPI0002ACC759|nr:DNA-3-methyladenine glycosylase [Leptolyngbya sp. PCC 6406]